MEIREAKRGKCRTCNNEIDGILWKELPLSYNLPQTERMKLIARREEREKQLEKQIRSSTKLFALEAHTASGSGTEIICERHLREFTEELVTFIKGLRA